MQSLTNSERYHIVAWLAVALLTYATAGPYTLASRWILIPLLLLSPKIAFLAAVALGLLIIIVEATKARSASMTLNPNAHIAIFTLDWLRVTGRPIFQSAQ